MIPRGLGKIDSDGRTTIIIDNFGIKPIHLTKGTIVATWCEGTKGGRSVISWNSMDSRAILGRLMDRGSIRFSYALLI
jgi:hypothetical protein